MYVYVYIYIYIYVYNAACLMRPHLFYALFVVSTIIIRCYIIRHF